MTALKMSPVIDAFKVVFLTSCQTKNI